jgi:hypothetical protein
MHVSAACVHGTHGTQWPHPVSAVAERRWPHVPAGQARDLDARADESGRRSQRVRQRQAALWDELPTRRRLAAELAERLREQVWVPPEEY